MSGGERKKRISQGTGWEEAGGEFYQECYPGGELDLEALPRDPHYFATLLPSKQTRAGIIMVPNESVMIIVLMYVCLISVYITESP